MARYKNNGGGHILANGTEIKNGQVFETDEVGIQKRFPNKFEFIPENTPAPAPAAPVPEPEKEEGEGKAASGAAADAKDVTKEFKEAVANDLVVKKDKAGYWITDDGDPLHEGALKTKTAVNKEIETYVKG